MDERPDPEGGPDRDEVLDQVPSRYRVHLLQRAKPTDRGVLYQRGEAQFLLAWGRVKRAFAALVGEPDGVHTIVLDLAVEVSGPECVVCRLEVAPGDEAMRAARAVELGVAPEAVTPSLESLAAEGVARTAYADLDALAEATLEWIRFRR
jgi:hypothetical protein